MIACDVYRRPTEIGIRGALGATPVRVLTLVLARVSLLLAVGIGLGSAATFWLSRFVTTLLYGVRRV